MKKALSILILIVYIFSQTIIINSAPVDITILENSSSREFIYPNDNFDFTLKFQNTSGEEISDLFIVMDQGSSFTGKNGNNFTNIKKQGTDTYIAVLPLVYNSGAGDLRLIIKYKRGTGRSVTEYSYPVTIPVKVYTNNENMSSSIITNPQNKPVIGVDSDMTVPSVKAGETLRLSLPIKNISEFSAMNVKIELGISAIPAIPDKVSYKYEFERIAPYTYRTTEANLKIKTDAAAGIYALDISYTFFNVGGESFTTTEKVNVKVENDADTQKPSLKISGTTLSTTRVKAGEKVKLTVEVENTGTGAAEDVKVNVAGLSTEGFSISSGTDVVYISKINGKSKATAEFLLVTKDKMTSGNYSLDISVKSGDINESAKVFIPVDGKDEDTDDKKPLLVIEDVKGPTVQLKADQEFSVNCAIKNIGEGEAKNVKLTIVEDKDIIATSLVVSYLPSLAAGGNHSATFKLKVSSSAVTKNYPLAVTVSYEYIEDSVTKTQQELKYIGIDVKNEKTEEEEDKSVPKIIVSGYTYEPTAPNAGEKVKLQISFENTSNIKLVKNIKVSMSSTDGIFVPEGGTNTFFIDNIEPKGTMTKDLTLFSKPDAEPKSYPIVISIEYEDEKSNAFKTDETISIPLQQPMRLVTSEINTMNGMVGNPLNISLEFYNKGKSRLNNLSIDVEGDFAKQNTMIYMGNMESGYSNYYDAMITPNAAGSLKGYVVFTFEDNYGNLNEVKKEFTIEVAEMYVPENDPGMFPGGVDPNMPVVEETFFTKHINILGMSLLLPVVVFVPSGIVLLAVITIIVVAVRKSKKKAELMMDE